MGRDMLCKLHATIQCTPDGLFLSIPDDRAVQAVQFLRTVNDCLYYWTLPDFNMLNTFTVADIQQVAKSSPACATLMSAMRPVLQCQCTAAHNPSSEYKQRADAFLNTNQRLQCEPVLFVGPQGCTLPIQLSDQQNQLYDVKNLPPHVTVAVAPGHEPDGVAKMMAQALLLRAAKAGSHSQLITHLGEDLYMLDLSDQIILLPQSTF